MCNWKLNVFTNAAEKDRKTVFKAMTIFSNETCVRFVPKTEHHLEHIKFTKANVCGSTIGYRPNRSEPLDVTYSSYCLKFPGAIQHELLHVLGLFHEQSRPDRDDYITVMWENIDPSKFMPLKVMFKGEKKLSAEYYQNFVKINAENVETFGLPYDFKSLLHYPGNAFAKQNTNVTMVCKVSGGKEKARIY